MDLKWVDKEIAAAKPHSDTFSQEPPALVERQEALIDLQKKVSLPLRDFKDIYKQMSSGRGPSRARRRRGNDHGASLRSVISIAKYTNRACSSSIPGRQHRPDEGGGTKFEYRRGYKFDLRDLVDPSGHHPFDRRPGAHHPYSRAHDPKRSTR